MGGASGLKELREFAQGCVSFARGGAAKTIA
jgi:hypothetical protein